MTVVRRTFDGALGWVDVEATYARRRSIERPRHFVATTTAALLTALGVAGGATASAIATHSAAGKQEEAARVQSDAAVKAAQIQADAAQKAADEQAKSATEALNFTKAQAQLSLDQYNAKEARLTPYRNLGAFAMGTPQLTPMTLRDLSLSTDPPRTPVAGGGDPNAPAPMAGGPTAVARRAVSPFAPTAPTVPTATPTLSLNDLRMAPAPSAATYRPSADGMMPMPTTTSQPPPYLALRDFLLQRAS